MGTISLNELQALDTFRLIANETLNKLIDASETQNYIKGKHVFRDKDEENTIYIVISGKVALYKTNDKGQKRVIFILDKGKIINEVMLQDMPTSINCEAFEACKLLAIKKHQLLELMRMDFQLMEVVLDAMAIKIRRMYRQLKNATAVIKVEKRIAAKLWKLGKDYGVKTDEGILIDMIMSNTYIADLLGIQRETVSRSLKILCNEKLMRYEGKKILILDAEKLSDFFKRL